MVPVPPPDPASGADGAPRHNPEGAALLQCLLHGDRDPVTVYNAVQEIRVMSGEVVVARLTSLIDARFAEVNRRMDAKFAETNGKLAETNGKLAETNGRLAAVETQLKIIWALLIPIALTLVAAAIGVVLR